MAKAHSVDPANTKKSTPKDQAANASRANKTNKANREEQAPLLLASASKPLELPETATIMDFTVTTATMDLKSEIFEVTEVAESLSVSEISTTLDASDSPQAEKASDSSDTAPASDAKTSEVAAAAVAAVAATTKQAKSRHNKKKHHKAAKATKSQDSNNSENTKSVKVLTSAEALDSLDAASAPLEVSAGELSKAPKFTMVPRRTEIIWGVVTAVLAIVTGFGLFMMAGERSDGEALGDVASDIVIDSELPLSSGDCADDDNSDACKEAKSSESDKDKSSTDSDSASQQDAKSEDENTSTQVATSAARPRPSATSSFTSPDYLDGGASSAPGSNTQTPSSGNSASNNNSNSGATTPVEPPKSEAQIACENSAAPTRLTFIEWNNTGSAGTDIINVAIEEYNISASMQLVGGICTPMQVQLGNRLSNSVYTSLADLQTAAAAGDFMAEVALDSRVDRLVWSWPSGKAIVENGSFYDIIDRRK